MRKIGRQRWLVFLAQALALVALALPGGQDLLAQSAYSPAFNPIYGPAADATRKKIVVTNTSDTFDGNISSWSALIANPGPDGISLREALTVANLTTGPKEIDFAPALKGATIIVSNVITQPLPYLTSGDLILDGDIDHDGQPDVTLESSAATSYQGLEIWSDNNHVNGLQLRGFAGSPILMSPPSAAAQKTAVNNRFTNNRLEATRGEGVAVSIGTFGLGLAPFISGFTWSNTTIAGNSIVATGCAIQLICGGGASYNQILNSTIHDNVMSGAGFDMMGADTNSAYYGAQFPGPAVYSTNNLIKNTVVRHNQIAGAAYYAIHSLSGNMGNHENRVVDLTISDNTISRCPTGIHLTAGEEGSTLPTRDNRLENVTIEENTIVGAQDGIVVGAGEKFGLGSPFSNLIDNQVNQLAIRDNMITGYTRVGIEVWGGRGNNSTLPAQGNGVMGTVITNNTLTTDRSVTFAGILLMGGFTLDERNAQYVGPALQNYLQSVTVTGNQIQGGATSIKVTGGRGLFTTENYITGLVLADNQVDTPPVLVDNERGAVGNQVRMLPSAPQPVVVASPLAQAVSVGDHVTLHVIADGQIPLSYQWRKDGQPIPSATESMFVLGAAQARDAGSYDVVITNAAGSVTSAAAPLVVGPGSPPPILASAPAGQTIGVGGMATFTVLVTGIVPKSYQWQKDGMAITGATDRNYSIASVQSSDAGSYTVVVVDETGAFTSNAVVLTVLGPPVIVVQPVGQSALVGETVELGVVATGVGPFNYLWRRNGVADPQWTASTLTFTNITPYFSANFTVAVSNAYGSVTSEVVVVTVYTAPTITQQPAISNAPVSGVTNPNLTSISVVAAPPADIPRAYQWQLDGKNIPEGVMQGTTAIGSIGTTTPNLVNVTYVGFYTALVGAGSVSDPSKTTTSNPLLFTYNTNGGVGFTQMGAWESLAASNIHHANGNVYAQLLLDYGNSSHPATPILARDISGTPQGFFVSDQEKVMVNGVLTNKITRASFIDENDDIVQIEYSGSGTVNWTVENFQNATPPVKYNQAAVSYMKAHLSLVIAGADETSNLSVFTVGKATAVDQALFKAGVTYDGIADIGYVAITSNNGKFGGIRTANVRYGSTQGFTGIYAPGVQFLGPIFVGNIVASGTAQPVLLTNGTTDARITGGNLAQPNGATIKVAGFSATTPLKFMAGSDSHGNLLPTQTNAGVLIQNGTDVTASVVVQN